MSKATKHSVYLIAAYAAISVLNYTFGVLLSWFFTPAQFGVLGVSQSLLLLTALVAGSGFAWTAAHDVARGGVTAQTRRRARAAWAANVTLGLLCALGLWVSYVLGWLSLGPAYRHVVPLVSLTVVVLAARSVPNGVARGLYRFEPVAVNLVGEVLIKIVVGLALVAAGLSVTGVMAGFALGAAVSLVHSGWIIRRERIWHGRGWMDRRVIVVTIPLFASLLGTALMLNLDVLGLRLLSPSGQGDEISGYYQAAVILARTPVFLAQALTLVLFSYAAGAATALPDRATDSFAYARTAVRSWFRFLLPVALVLILAPKTTLSLFFPTQYQAAASALRIAAAGGVLLALVNLFNGVLQAAGNRRQPALAAGLAAVVQITVLFALVPLAGANGAAFSLVTAALVALVVLGPGFWRRMIQTIPIRSPGRMAEALLWLAVPIAAMVLPLALLPDGTRSAALVKLALAGLVYLAALLMTHIKTLDLKRPMPDLLVQFVQVVIGA